LNSGRFPQTTRRKDSESFRNPLHRTPGEIPRNIGECNTLHFLHLDTFYPRPGDFRPGHYQLSYQELVCGPERQAWKTQSGKSYVADSAIYT